MLLAQRFLRTETEALKTGRISFAQSAMAALSAGDWPGNVRELHNCIRRALSVCTSKKITAEDLGLGGCIPDPTEDKFLTLQQARDQAEQHCVRKALMLTGSNISETAKLLNTSRPTLHDLIKKHDLRT